MGQRGSAPTSNQLKWMEMEQKERRANKPQQSPELVCMDSPGQMMHGRKGETHVCLACKESEGVQIRQAQACRAPSMCMPNTQPQRINAHHKDGSNCAGRDPSRDRASPHELYVSEVPAWLTLLLSYTAILILSHRRSNQQCK